MEVLVIDARGKSLPLTLDRSQISERLKIHTRDLRAVYLTRVGQILFSRGKNILAHLGRWKLIITAGAVYIFADDKEQLASVKSKIQDHLQQKRPENFSLNILELILEENRQSLWEQWNTLQPKVRRTLNRISRRLEEKDLEIFLYQQRGISALLKQANTLQEELSAILQDPEELQRLYLSNRQQKDITAIESLLEYHQENAEELVYQLQDFKEDIDNTQEVITLKLNGRRNTIIRLDLIGTLFAVLFSFMTFITGLYGMNLLNGWEDSTEAFWWISLMIGLGSFLLIITGWIYLRKQKLL